MFLTYPTKKNVSTSTHSQAFNALFLSQNILHKSLKTRKIQTYILVGKKFKIIYIE